MTILPVFLFVILRIVGMERDGVNSGWDGTVIGLEIAGVSGHRERANTGVSAMTTQGLMKGKRGLIMGVANNRSIAWGVAEALHKAGAELAFSYQGEVFRKRVVPLVEPLKPAAMIDCDVGNQGSIDGAFAELSKIWPSIDFVVHAIAFSDKDQLVGRYVDTTPENFRQTMDISCYSFTAVAQRAEKMMPKGGSMVTLTYYGAEKVMPHYNVMGVAKAALEASVRYMAEDLGKKQIRVNAISAGPIKTLAFAGIADSAEVERVQLAAATQCDDRRGRQLGALSAFRHGECRHRRNAACRCRLSRRRHEGGRRTRHHSQQKRWRLSFAMA
jgi:enoyl-[acyl-carrier protein] reductase I